jgi:hypothetical protein
LSIEFCPIDNQWLHKPSTRQNGYYTRKMLQHVQYKSLISTNYFSLIAPRKTLIHNYAQILYISTVPPLPSLALLKDVLINFYSGLGLPSVESEPVFNWPLVYSTKIRIQSFHTTRKVIHGVIVYRIYVIHRGYHRA